MQRIVSVPEMTEEEATQGLGPSRGMELEDWAKMHAAVLMYELEVKRRKERIWDSVTWGRNPEDYLILRRLENDCIANATARAKAKQEKAFSDLQSKSTQKPE